MSKLTLWPRIRPSPIQSRNSESTSASVGAFFYHAVVDSMDFGNDIRDMATRVDELSVPVDGLPVSDFDGTDFDYFVQSWVISRGFEVQGYVIFSVGQYAGPFVFSGYHASNLVVRSADSMRLD